MPSSKKQVLIRTTDEEHAEWVAAARDAGVSLNDYTAEAVREKMRGETTSTPERGAASPSLQARETKQAKGFSRKGRKEDASTSVNKGGCGVYSPRGTKCKMCGQYHQ